MLGTHKNFKKFTSLRLHNCSGCFGIRYIIRQSWRIQGYQMKQWHQNTCYDIEHCTFSRPLWDHNMYWDPKWWISCWTTLKRKKLISITN